MQIGKRRLLTRLQRGFKAGGLRESGKAGFSIPSRHMETVIEVLRSRGSAGSTSVGSNPYHDALEPSWNMNYKAMDMALYHTLGKSNEPQ